MTKPQNNDISKGKPTEAAKAETRKAENAKQVTPQNEQAGKRSGQRIRDAGK